ncbi:MAG: transcriptional regulator, partial [Paludibacteraceae bacterium]|nr:transcriptional regulator [Paludibacteraceae bacterium]
QVTPQVTPQVKGLLSVLNSGDKNVLELMDLLKLKDRRNFRLNYLQPTIALGLAEMTIPDKPRSKNQSYRLTEKGKKY